MAQIQIRCSFVWLRLEMLVRQAKPRSGYVPAHIRVEELLLQLSLVCIGIAHLLDLLWLFVNLRLVIN